MGTSLYRPKSDFLFELDMNFRLEDPSSKFKETYISFVKEFTDRGEDLIPFPLQYPYDKFESLLKKLENHSKGVGMKDGFVANSTFWLIDQSEKLVGVSNLRHKLTPNLLREGGNIGYGVCPSERGKKIGAILLKETFKKAKDIGLDKVLITCGKVNLGSMGVIINNGGVLDSEEFLPELNEIIQRYWINIR